MTRIPRLIILALAALLVVSAVSADELPHPPLFKSFDSAAAVAGDKPILIDFYTDWCIWCKRLDSNVFSQPEVIEFFTNEAVLAKVDAEEDTALAQQYRISGYPTTVLVHADGTEIDRIVGYAEADEYLQTLRDYRQGIGTLDDLLTRAEDSSDRELYFEIGNKFKYRGAADDATAWLMRVVDAGEPNDSLSGEALMSLADMHRRAKDYETALAGYQSVESDFKGQLFEEYAVIWQAIVYGQMDETQKAVETFRDFVNRFPDSEDVDYAKKKIDELSSRSDAKK